MSSRREISDLLIREFAASVRKADESGFTHACRKLTFHRQK